MYIPARNADGSQHSRAPSFASSTGRTGIQERAGSCLPIRTHFGQKTSFYFDFAPILLNEDSSLRLNLQLCWRTSLHAWQRQSAGNRTLLTSLWPRELQKEAISCTLEHCNTKSRHIQYFFLTDTGPTSRLHKSCHSRGLMEELWDKEAQKLQVQRGLIVPQIDAANWLLLPELRRMRQQHLWHSQSHGTILTHSSSRHKGRPRPLPRASHTPLRQWAALKKGTVHFQNPPSSTGLCFDQAELPQGSKLTKLHTHFLPREKSREKCWRIKASRSGSRF